ncbi:uncharacterized protein L3040_005770 [Drepanopeziza brunnea f. sp. 'multigermtubi']|uniref:uncharacterized protein n=1 Tax=Drepanopeziza brunnea f. sp. 'multigermtubi' TaxID=698441 RepID=UPI0023959E47|nr:hypothetical protein L3040_005770 [Drepanopeziza brunnea f. sp. 'multigermtubi']
MAPPRFQCLNMVRQITKKGLNVKAAFSTSHASRFDEPPRARGTTEDLMDLFPQRSAATPKMQQPASQITLGSGVVTADAPVGNQRVYNLIRKSKVRADERKQAMRRSSAATEDYTNHLRGQDLSKQITRRWKVGDIYAPHDLSEVEMAKWKRRGKPLYDVFDVLNLNPMEHYRNFSIMSEYMTEMGRIRHSKDTGLRPVNQRKIARAIRRTIGMGLMPSVHQHPEILYKEVQRYEQNTAFKAHDAPTGIM